MKSLVRIAVAALAFSLAAHGLQAAEPAAKGKKEDKKVHMWWKESFPSKPFQCADAKKLPRISVKGNRFVDPNGKPVLFRGVSIADPDKTEALGHWSREYFVGVQTFGTKLVRIPVHPVAWRNRTPEGYMALLDQAINWCTELNMHVIIDWHSIGNLKAGLFQDPMYITSEAETAQFWRTIAQRYAGNHTVAFYELYNEPTTYNGQLGHVSWSDWKKVNEDLIFLIRSFDKEAIPLVAGFDWAYDLTPLNLDPIGAEGIGYVVHPYPWKRSKPYEPKWDENFGFAAGKYPIVATEIGFNPTKADSPDAGYGEAIINFLEGRNISWTAWVYDPDWDPQLIKDFEGKEYTESGAFFSKAMKK